MDGSALAYGRLHSALNGCAPGAALLGGDLRELLFLDDPEMWGGDADADVDTPPAGEPRRLGDGAGFAPAGVRESAGAREREEAESAAAAAAQGESGHARVCSHPLWPVLVDYYFACRKARARRGDARRPRPRVRPCGPCEPTARESLLDLEADWLAFLRAFAAAAAQVGASDSATIRAINSERAELAHRVQEVRGRRSRRRYQASRD